MSQSKATLEGRKVGVLLTDGFDSSLLHELQSAVDAERALAVRIAPEKRRRHQ